jgi:histidine ammonia-lyase
MKTVILTGQDLTIEELALVCRQNAPVALSEEAKARVLKSRATVERIVDEKRVVYGVTTGFGKFSDVVISPDECALLQENLIVTHAVGAGKPFSRDIARGILLLRINNVIKGFSGIRPETVDTMVEMLNRGVTPIIPEKGSLGASGDLAPLSHMVLPMIGLGEAEYEGEVLPRWRGHGSCRHPHHPAGRQGRSCAHQRHTGHDGCWRSDRLRRHRAA